MGLRQEIERLSSALSAAEHSASDSQRLREELRRMEAQHVASLTNLRKEAAAMQNGFAATERERDQLLQEVSLLNFSKYKALNEQQIAQSFTWKIIFNALQCETRRFAVFKHLQ